MFPTKPPVSFSLQPFVFISLQIHRVACAVGGLLLLYFVSSLYSKLPFLVCRGWSVFGLDLYQVGTKPSRQTNGAAASLTSTHLFKHLPPPPRFATHTRPAQYSTPVPSALVRHVKKVLLCSGSRTGSEHYYTVHARCLLQLYFILGTWLHIEQKKTFNLLPFPISCHSISTQSSFHSPMLLPPFFLYSHIYLPLTFSSTQSIFICDLQ